MVTDNITAEETPDGQYQVTISENGSKITKKLSEKEIFEEFKNFGALSDQEVEIANQLGIKPIIAFKSGKCKRRKKKQY